MNNLAVYTATAQADRCGQDELVVQHAPLVKRIAYHLLSRLPACVQAEDLIQAGMIGLLEAGRNYDPSQGASFETYAGIRIRGAMLDEIRKGDWAPRSLHRRIREISQAIREIEGEKGRDAKDFEVAERLNISLDEYYQALQDANNHQVLSFEDLPTKDTAMTEGLSANIQGPLDALMQEDTKRILAQAIESLPERERLVMSLYYDEELNLRETGEVLGVSESRVCQIHSQAMLRLRARISVILEDD